ALFHDIGKLRMPQYFVENNRDSAEMHARLSPRVSAIIIRNHVQSGLILARKYRLFRYVREAIATHHGNDLVRYFYNKAQEKRRAAGDPETAIHEEEFRYNGTPPYQKELVIISLADACEAATRSISSPSKERIEKMVDDIIDARMRGGQLCHSALTLGELAEVRKCLVKTLIGIHHGRIAYSHGEKK
ncbi:MAG: HDIG domain-containing protein, partial [Victivallaceae bacterium]|nr:HDIG domain-containing protein [Victivallaceae bacterium]